MVFYLLPQNPGPAVEQTTHIITKSSGPFSPAITTTGSNSDVSVSYRFKSGELDKDVPRYEIYYQKMKSPPQGMPSEQMYEIAKNLGVTDFVVPGNKPEKIKEYRKLLGEDAVFYSPGLVAQGGSLTEGAESAGKYWHAIVGRGIYQAENMKKAAEEMVSKLV